MTQRLITRVRAACGHRGSLWLRRIDVFLSPDSRQAAFIADGKLQTRCPRRRFGCDDLRGPTGGARWHAGRGRQYRFRRDIWRTDAGAWRRTMEPFTPLDPPEITHRWPQFLPGGKAAFYQSQLPDLVEPHESTSSRWWTGGAATASTARCSEGSSPIRRRRILDVRPQRDSFAAAFDPVRLELLGPPFAVFEGVAYDNSRAAQMDASRTGSIIARRQPKFHVAWLTRRARRRCLRRPETISAPCCRMPATGSRSPPCRMSGLRHPPAHTARK